MDQEREIIGYGVCRLSVVPVRSQPADFADLSSQLLFGEHYILLERSKDKRWVMIKNRFDGYGGWIDVKQHHPIAKEYFEFIDRGDAKITTDLVAGILYNKVHVPVLIGSIIPNAVSDLFRMEEQFAFNGESKSLSQKRNVDFIVELAKKYLNAPYQWGGRIPFGIDCSGFTQIVFKISGYKLPRNAADQANCGRPIPDLGKSAPGDLAFFGDTTGRTTHVGIIVEDNKIIHASGRVRLDWLNEEGILNVDTKIYTHALVGMRRILDGI
jgi:gamma-D-glutamyl-L-lysine dipeptidyl-peptidase